MKSWLLLCVAFLAGCAVLPEDGPKMQKLSGQLVFSEVTALAPGSVARISVIPAFAGADSKPIFTEDIPAKSGSAIPFAIKFSAAKIEGLAEYLVIAQVMDHGVVRYSNLTSPLRLSFFAEPGPVSIPLRPETL